MSWKEAVVSLDGVPLPASAFDGERLHLPRLGGDHLLEVDATITRTRQRTGMHRAVDPTDGEVYVWTDVEPDDARRVYACFDQPDLKAPVAFTVHTPPEWTVVSNSAVRHRTATSWVFDDTPPLSTYVTVICAGPFHRLSRTVDGYELALLARPTLAPYLDEQADELFDLTSIGLRHFADRFGIAFPQPTYTQVFCPDFSGAMENWGCVTWTDQFLFRSTPTDAQKYDRVVFLLHEMAHMWFGDLVTLRWWDDLWLNESFADWAALDAAERATPFAAVLAGWPRGPAPKARSGPRCSAPRSTSPRRPATSPNSTGTSAPRSAYAGGGSRAWRRSATTTRTRSHGC